MKKIAILCLTIFMVVILVHPVNAAIVVLPDPDEEKAILSDWSINESNYEIVDFEQYRHINFGAAKYLGVSKSLSDKLVYDSYWNAFEPSRYVSYIKYEYNLYEFTKFVDMPVNIIHTRNLNPGDIAEFSIGNTASFTESRTQTVSVGIKYYTEFIRTFGFKLGISVPIEGINVGASQHDSTDIKVGLEFYRTIETVISSESNFSSIYSESFRWYNGTNTNQYYQLNYRQKFKIYFVAIYEHQYTRSEWGTGMLGLDKNYSYHYSALKGVETRFFLIPFESPYFEISKYYDDSQGRKVIYGKHHDFIYYIYGVIIYD